MSHLPPPYGYYPPPPPPRPSRPGGGSLVLIIGGAAIALAGLCLWLSSSSAVNACHSALVQFFEESGCSSASYEHDFGLVMLIGGIILAVWGARKYRPRPPRPW